MDTFAQQPPLPLVTPPDASSRGVFGVLHMPMQMAHVTRGRLLFWRRPITRYHIGFRRALRRLHVFEMIGGAVWMAGFFLLFLFSAAQARLIDSIFFPSFWFGQQTPAHIFFWLGTMGAGFLFYRALAMQERIEPVEAYEKKDVPVDAPPVADPFGVIEKKNRKDISHSFTTDALQAMEDAYTIADRYHNSSVMVAHVFHALLSAPKIATICIRLGIPPKMLQAHMAKGFQTSAEKRDAPPVFSDDVWQILFHAYEHAYTAKQAYVHVTELFLAAVRQSPPLQELLFDLKVDAQKLENAVEWLRIQDRLFREHKTFQRAAARRNKYGLDRAMTAVATPFLNGFSQDMTMIAKYGGLAPCVARNKEIDEIFRVIEGGRQSVLLVGDRGVGKRSIVEGIAARMIEDDVPAALYDKRLVQLSTSTLLAGTTMQGAEQRLIGIMNEIQKAGNIILFINNLHDLMGADDGAEGLDISETLAEFLGPGKFLTIATTTLDGYNRHILRSELGKDFARVDVKEMNENQAIQVLESKAAPMEYKHRVFFSYDALQTAATLAHKLIKDQYLPESAIGIMSEAASATRHKKGEHVLVEANDVAEIVSEKTGIPTTSITEDESEKLMRLEASMHERVIGQDEAVRLVASALRRARAEIRSQKKPIASFLFLGPTGVGKTELAKTIAEVYFGGEKRMIRVDMSEFQDKSGVYRLIGQPGQQGTGILTEAVRQQPFSLVLLDEMEKADPDILNLFLQVFDDGRLTDATGRTIDFTNTIIIATSNAGTQYVQDELNKGVSTTAIRDALVRGELKKYYRPEFLNRFDGIVLFQPLDKPAIRTIASLMLKRVAHDLEARGIFFRAEDSALDALADAGFDPEFGARPMRRAIQEKVEDPLADLILQKQLDRRDTVVLGDGAEVRVEKGK